MKKIELSEHFTIWKMAVYSLPSIFESFATTSFQAVDGYFVSNMLGISPYAALGLISPVFFILYALGFMFGDGASAQVSQYMGEGDKERGKRIFTMTTVVMLITGLVVGIIAAVMMPIISRWIGADDNNIKYCVAYGRTMVYFLPLYMVNSAYMSLWITAEKGWYGMLVSALNGASNVVLDWLFMGPLNMGITGAGLASSLGAAIAAIITLVYFGRPNQSSLRFVRFKKEDLREIFQLCFNGASEMMDNVMSNLTGMLMNFQLLRYLGETGVAALNSFDYIMELFMAVMFGITTTSVTVVGYKYGERRRDELDSLIRTNTVLTLFLGVVISVLFIILTEPVVNLYIGYDPKTFALAIHSTRIMALSCVLLGFNMFVSAFFTGLGNGLISTIISVCNSLVAQVVMLYTLPAIFGEDGIWYSVPAATVAMFLLCLYCLRVAYYRKKDLWEGED